MSIRRSARSQGNTLAAGAAVREAVLVFGGPPASRRLSRPADATSGRAVRAAVTRFHQARQLTIGERL